MWKFKVFLSLNLVVSLVIVCFMSYFIFVIFRSDDDQKTGQKLA